MLENYCHLSGGETILDVGCGDGRATHLLATMLTAKGGGSVVGVDASPSQIEYASTTHHAPHLTFRVADARQLPAEYRRGFDWIVSFNCLHWIPDLQAVLSSLARCLKPGGKLLISFPSFPPFMERLLQKLPKMEKWRQYFQDAKDPYPWKVYPNFEDETQHGMKLQRNAFVERMGELLASAGLDSQMVELTTTVSIFKDEHSLKEHVAQWLDYRQRIPEDLREEFMQDFLDNYRDTVKDRAFSDLSRYNPNKEGGVRTEIIHARILVTKPGRW